MNYVISFFSKVFRSEVDALERDREYIIHFGTSIKNARKEIRIIDYSVKQDEQLTSPSRQIRNASTFVAKK